MKRKLFISLLILLPLILFAAPITKWKISTPFKHSLYAHSAVAGSGKIYVVGGFSLKTRNCSSSLYSFNPLTSTWHRLSPMKHERGFAGAVSVNGKIYVIGGNDRSRTLNYTEIYNPAFDSWSYGAPMPTPRRGFAISVLGNKIYCFGGFNIETKSTLKTVEVYDTVKNKWSKLPSMSFPRQGAAAVTIGNNIYVIGGVIGTASRGRGPIFLRDVSCYQVSLNKWKKAPSLIFNRYYLSAVSHNGNIYVIGGIKGLRPINKVEVININSNTRWIARKNYNLNMARNAPASVILDGVIYTIGGLGKNGDLKSIETLRIE